MLTYLACLLLSFLGLGLHWFKRYYRKQTENTFLQYLGIELKYTIVSVCTVIGTTSIMVENSDFDLSSPSSLAKFIMIGYTIDSLTNKE